MFVSRLAWRRRRDRSRGHRQPRVDAAPSVVCLALAAACAVLTVSNAIMPQANLLYVVFPTPTIVRLYGASKFGAEDIGLAAERVGLTVLFVRPFWNRRASI